MKRYVDRVRKALNLDEQEFDNFLRLLRSNERDSLILALGMMRGRTNATAKEMKAMFAHYVLMPIFYNIKSARQVSVADISEYYTNKADYCLKKPLYTKAIILEQMLFKACITNQFYYIKKFVQCTPTKLQSTKSILVVAFGNAWKRHGLIFAPRITNTCEVFSACLNELYGNTCMYY